MEGAREGEEQLAQFLAPEQQSLRMPELEHEAGTGPPAEG